MYSIFKTVSASIGQTLHCFILPHPLALKQPASYQVALIGNAIAAAWSLSLSTRKLLITHMLQLIKMGRQNLAYSAPSCGCQTALVAVHVIQTIDHCCDWFGSYRPSSLLHSKTYMQLRGVPVCSKEAWCPTGEGSKRARPEGGGGAGCE